jgi:CheY-like chemotaxis protein
MARAAKEKFLVLLVDDSDDDCLLVSLALQKSPRLQLLEPLRDGDEAIAYLSGAGKYADRARYPFPDMLLLDLKMPRVNGFEVLRWLQTQSFKDLLIVVLSGSIQQPDMTKSLGLGAHYYQQKQLDLAGQHEVVKMLESYLFSRRNADT